MKLILASASARRRELLTTCGYDFTVIPSSADEHVEANTPSELVEQLALKKASSVFNALSPEDKKNAAVVGSDTVVVLDGSVMGKPSSREDAFNMLKMESGRVNTVYTGIAVVTLNSGSASDSEGRDACLAALADHDAARVKFAVLSDEEIQAYVDSGDPLDKAGAYGIQGPFSVFVESVEGSYFTVVGLPVHKLYRMLKSVGIVPKL